MTQNSINKKINLKEMILKLSKNFLDYDLLDSFFADVK
jgi:hypothetical protein